jgi:hypothetical protein
VHRTHAQGGFPALVYLTLTGGGTQDWLRVERNVRLARLCFHVALYAALLMVKELIGRQVVRR